MGTDTQIEFPIIFFDGVCNLCNASVMFVIKRDKKNYFQFASLQSDFACKNLPSGLTGGTDMPSLVLVDGKTLTRSSAALTIAKHLSGLWPVLYFLMIIPPFIRHAVYNFIARNRYRWFGKQEQCMIPSKELKARFIE